MNEGRRETFKVSSIKTVTGGVSGYHVVNQDRTIERFIMSEPDFDRMMAGKDTKFVFGHIDLLTRKMIFEEEAPWQTWK